VLDMPGSAATLADLALSNMLLVPLDRRGEWYRYHHLFRDRQCCIGRSTHMTGRADEDVRLIRW
jgi:hypothetical protein